MIARSAAAFGLVFLLLAALLAQPSKPSGSQDSKDSKDDKKAEARKPPAPPPFKDGRLDDEKDKLTLPEQSDMRKLVFGTEDAPTGARRTAVLDKACRYFIYRLTSPDVQEGRDGSISQLMEEILGGPNQIPQGRLYFNLSKQANPDPEEIARRRRQWTAVEQIRPMAITHVQKVMELNSLIARLNALRILHRFAELNFEQKGNEEVADVFTQAIENPHEHDAVRLWAFKGLQALFASQTNPTDAVKVKDAGRMNRAALAICNWLDARCKMDQGVVEQMSPEERDGISYVRRWAIRALAASRRPLVKDDKGVREGPVAQLLLHLISTEETNLPSPRATWPEAVDAAAAICQLQPKLSPSYQPDFVAHQLARFVAHLGAQANQDPTRQKEVWREFAYQLRTALEPWAADVPADRGGSYVKTAAAQIDKVIENLFDNTKNPQAAQELFAWVNANPPKAKSVYNPPL